ncbi:MAG: 4-hydroxy-3-methylbut-2-en-1-yl diphosphate synthase [Clostridia bacterium]|nr:4-hydroxy-3-methylbut-2-en-1-yl diphosphate synthase [Clostridia bacterium]MBP5269328.1 4-hydroxy-3-methylbut-2-en-1-yl diphosphate synthase [Clostridia bacterium]
MYNFGRIEEKRKRGEVLFGTHVFCGAPSLTEAISLIGFDMIWIDMEHTAIGIESLQNNLIAARAGGTPAFVRIPWNDRVLAKPVIDMGPEGIIFPYIRSADDARAAVAACEYPPKGERGYGPLRALDYGGIAQTDFVDRVYRRMWRILQIEHIDAVNDLDGILDVEGIDAYVVGPNDLSASMGHIGRTDHPDMIPVYDTIGRKMTERGKLFGVSIGFVPEVVGSWLARGAGMIFAGNDVGYVHDGACAVLDGLKTLAG